ncbi:asparagine synthase (glutamine-hydrolysing) [Cytobacillus firmus]|uniref:asparagine synthase (glutamine-hydrolyzing) n=2 Tax=Cytobacillus TaxID=2675230 RepID=A0A366JPA2_CYTFI|nr:MULTISPECIES: asparagine synthase-related protein [Cytobacillus]RBP88296.1 asparagine synthase (glutamine-hydrolysing) [Cytobacillus firmus]TDX38369.1 asparagine synthase (glutamine-hydrolysing) [Cytobacillus oceanisediminis]
MSAILGTYHFKDDSNHIEDCNKMMNYLESFPYDDKGVWQSERLFFGCHNQWISPESVGGHLPSYDSEHQLVITSDAIIDNRNDLFERLQVSYSERKSISDSKLILLAYLKWGKDSPKYLIGDFAFMIWDERKQLLFGARDFSGSRTLYYYNDPSRFVFCTIIEPMFRLPYIRKRINEEWLAEFLVIPTMVESTDIHKTVYKNINQLPPAHTIIIDKDKIALERYWNLGSLNTLKLKSDSEYEEAFRDVFNIAVSEKLRTHGKVGSHLSGGLDSGTVVSFASKALKNENKQLYTYSYIPEDDFTDWTPNYYLADERVFIKETVNHVGNIKDHYLNFQGKNPLLEVDDFLALMEMPYKFFENAFWLKGINETAHSQGVKVLLNGSRGNHSISWGSWRLTIDYYASLLKKLKLLQLNQELNSYCRIFRTGKKTMLPIVAKNAFPRASRMFVRNGVSDYCFPSYINEDFAVKTNVYDRLQQREAYISGDFKGDLNQYRKEHYDQLYYWIKSGTATTKLSLRYSLWDRDPTNDLRVINFCLSLPEEQYVKNGMERSFLRRATKNFLPEKVRLNHNIRGIQGADAIHRMSSKWSCFVDELIHIKKDSMMSEILNLEVVNKAIENIKGQPDPNYVWTDDFKLLTRSLIVSRFLRTFS